MAARKSPAKSSPRPRADNAARGTGGELHFSAGGKHPPLTTNQGIPVSDNQNSLRAHDRGPTRRIASPITRDATRKNAPP